MLQDEWRAKGWMNLNFKNKNVPGWMRAEGWMNNFRKKNVPRWMKSKGFSPLRLPMAMMVAGGVRGRVASKYWQWIASEYWMVVYGNDIGNWQWCSPYSGNVMVSWWQWMVGSCPAKRTQKYLTLISLMFLFFLLQWFVELFQILSLI